jgi:hypothetical protein
MKQTAVEWLAEKIDYAYCMVKRDEISPALAEEWKKHYLEQAKEMEKQQIIDAYTNGDNIQWDKQIRTRAAEQHYNETFKSK